FKFTMPASAAAGSTHTFYGVMAIPGIWNKTSLTITTKAPLSAPTSVTASGSSTSLPLSWTGGGPQYRVLYKTLSFQTGPHEPNATDAYDGSGNSTTVTGLSVGTRYYFAV